MQVGRRLIVAWRQLAATQVGRRLWVAWRQLLHRLVDSCELLDDSCQAGVLGYIMPIVVHWRSAAGLDERMQHHTYPYVPLLEPGSESWKPQKADALEVTFNDKLTTRQLLSSYVTHYSHFSLTFPCDPLQVGHNRTCIVIRTLLTALEHAPATNNLPVFSAEFWCRASSAEATVWFAVLFWRLHAGADAYWASLQNSSQNDIVTKTLLFPPHKMLIDCSLKHIANCVFTECQSITQVTSCIVHTRRCANRYH